MAAIWAGIDAGETHHHCVVIDEDGRRLLSRQRVSPANTSPLLPGGAQDQGAERTGGGRTWCARPPTVVSGSAARPRLAVGAVAGGQDEGA